MAILAMVFWGMSYVWVKIAYLYLGPFSTVFLRLTLSATIIIAIAAIFRIPILPKREDLKAFMLLAFFEPFAYFIGESMGLERVSSSVASIMIGTIPLFIPIFAYYILKEKVTILNIIGLVISFIGLFILIFKEDFTFDASPSGIALMMLAVTAGTLYTIQLKKVSSIYHPVTIIIQMNFFGLLYFLPLFLYFEGRDFLQVNFNFELITTIAQLVIFSSLGALFFFIYAIERIGVTKTTMFTNLIPVVTAITAWIILPEEQFSLKLALGIIIVIFGVFIGQRKIKRVKNQGKPLLFTLSKKY